MGKLLSTMTRPLRNYNIRQRAHKEIETSKAAPRHPQTQHMLDDVRQRFPEVVAAQQIKNEPLLFKLKDIYVTSKDPTQIVKTPAEEEEDVGRVRVMPTNRRYVPEPELGVGDPVRIPPGRFSLRQALLFISEHQSDPETHTAEAIARNYGLQPTDAVNVLRHFSTFQLHLQDSGPDDGTAPVVRLFSPTRQQLDNTTTDSKKDAPKLE